MLNNTLQCNEKQYQNLKTLEELQQACRDQMASDGFSFNESFISSDKPIKFDGRGDGRKLEWYKADIQTDINKIASLQVTYNSQHDDLKCDKNYTFYSKTEKPLSDADHEATKQRVRAEKERREKEAVEKEKAVQEQALKDRQRFEKSSKTGTSPYLERKQVEAHGIRFEGDVILIPMRDKHGQIQAIQEIHPQKKSFTKETKLRDKHFTNATKSLYHAMGEIKNGEPIRISEGYATAASVYESTGEKIPHVVAFSAGNYQHVLPILKERYPNSRITICADNNLYKDKTKKNVGLDEACNVAKKYNCEVIFPRFPEGKEYDNADFNDLMILEGKGAVKNYFIRHEEKIKEQEKLKKDRENIETAIQTELILSSKTPYNSAECLIENKFTYQGDRIVYFCGDAFWLWKERFYEEVKPNRIRQNVYDFLKNAKIEVKKKRDSQDKPEEKKEVEIELIGFDPNKSKVDNVIDAMKAICDSEQTPEAGASWIENRNFPLTKNLIVFNNGILDFERWILDKSTSLIPHTPLLLNPSYLPFDYNPQAKKPLNWIQFLNTIWKDDPQSIETLQEWFGLCLSQDLKFHKILMLVGPPRSGKGTISRILSVILGSLNVVNPTLASLSGAFGLQSWLNKSVAIISDARLSNKSDSGIIKERLLSISGEDPLTIDRKHRESITTTLPARIMILTNELPHLEDASSAMASRYLVLSLTESFLGKEDLDLEIRLRNELPEILLWALQGLERLRKRKRFIQPDSAKQHIEELYAMTSPIKSFVDDRCEIGVTKWIETKSLFKAWTLWCKENGYDRAGDEQLLGRNLRALLPQITSGQTRDANKNRIRIYKGIGLSILPNP